MKKMDNPNSELIYKVVSVDQWAIAEQQGEFAGAAIDLEDGFVHFSTASQVQETVARHFAGQRDLVLVGVDAGKLGDELRWETSRGGELFPHLYGNLSLNCVVSIDQLPIGKDGCHVFPGDLRRD